MRRRDFLTGAAALAGMTSQAEAFGFGNLGAEFGHMGSVLGTAPVPPPDPGAALIAWDDNNSVQQLLQWDDDNGIAQYLEWDV